MIYKSYNVSLVIRLVIFGATCSALSLTLINNNWLFSIPLIFALLISGFNLIYFLNSINRKVSYFFDAVINDDSTLHYSEYISPSSLRLLHKNLNKLNNHIADIKIRNEYNEKFFHEMLKYSATGLIAVDEKGYIEQINDSALEYFGMPVITHIDLLQQKCKDLYEQMLLIKPGQSKAIKILQGTELRLYSLKVAILNFGDKKYRLYSISDIRNELEENELDSWQKLIRVMTHEIMNSIAPITSLSNTLSRIFIKDKKPLPSSEVSDKHVANIIQGLEVIENTGKGLMRFVDDYRRLTKIPNPVFKSINITNWINLTRVLLESAFEEEGIEVKVIKKGNTDELIGDEKLLSQVVINILNNAIDALKGKSNKKIIISISDNQTGRLSLSISDNGKGIDPEEIEKIFIPFYTTKENGSGIGLSLSRKIMRLHKGSITAKSKPGENTTFVLNF